VGVAAVLFLVSVFNPFLSALLYGAEGSHVFLIGEVWSYRVSFRLHWWTWYLPNGSYGVMSNDSYGERWFADYWVLGRLPCDMTYWFGLFINPGGFAVSISLVVFVGQIMTLLLTGFFLLVRRHQTLWLFGAASWGLFTIVNMWHFSLQVVDFHSFEAGFWFALASDVLLFAVFVVSLVGNLRKLALTRREKSS